MDRPYRPASANTLDGQLAGYWAREATRLDDLAASTRFGWQRRRLARRAVEARGRAERFAEREGRRRAATDLSRG